MHLAQDKVTQLIYASISVLNLDRLQRKTAPIELSEGTILLGRQSKLDSLDLVTFFVDLEQRIKSEFNATISLTDEKAMFQKESPFETIRSLTAYICDREV